MSKVLFRIFYVICAALVIIILSAILGNHLKNKVAAVDETMQASDEATDLQFSRETSDSYDTSAVSSLSLKACGIDITSFTEQGEMLNAVDIAASYYDTLIIPVCSDDGNLIYSSPALEKILRHEISSENTYYDTLVSCINEAKKVNLDICVLLTPSANITSPSNAAFIDSTVISELSDIGADRVIIKLSNSFDESYMKWVRSYISSLEFEKDKVGIAFSPDYLLDANGIRQLQLFSSKGAFICVYFEGYTGSYDSIYDNTAHTLKSMLGIFDLYTVTALIGQSDSLAAVYNACADAEIDSISFVGYTLPSDLAKKLTDTATSADEAEKQTETEQQIITNPYAGTSLSSDANTETEEYEEDYDDSGYYDENSWY